MLLKLAQILNFQFHVLLFYIHSFIMAYGNITTLYEINLIPGTFLNSGDLIATDEGKTLSF